MVSLAQSDSLSDLDLTGCIGIAADGLCTLAQSTTIETLNRKDCNCGQPRDVHTLSSMKPLRSVFIQHTWLSREQLRQRDAEQARRTQIRLAEMTASQHWGLPLPARCPGLPRFSIGCRDALMGSLERLLLSSPAGRSRTGRNLSPEQYTPAQVIARYSGKPPCYFKTATTCHGKPDDRGPPTARGHPAKLASVQPSGRTPSEHRRSAERVTWRTTVTSADMTLSGLVGHADRCVVGQCMLSSVAKAPL
jgi:hypothetical protein